MNTVDINKQNYRSKGRSMTREKNMGLEQNKDQAPPTLVSLIIYTVTDTISIHIIFTMRIYPKEIWDTKIVNRNKEVYLLLLILPLQISR
jgi:hypothetical protein